MTISSSSLFHFTSNLESLKSILQHDFVSLYSAETFLNLISKKHEEIGLNKAVPMVCFCDIPISKVSRHSGVYGNYAIGLTKEWAIKNQISPVIYSYSDSAISNNLMKMFEAVVKESNEQAINNFDGLVQFIKPYAGDFHRKGQILKNIRFYDEREWRYIPDIFKDSKNSWLRASEKETLEESIIATNKILLETKYSSALLKFEAKDIKHIIVKNESEIHNLVSFFKSLKSNKYSIEEIEILMTKINCLEDIIADY